MDGGVVVSPRSDSYSTLIKNLKLCVWGVYCVFSKQGIWGLAGAMYSYNVKKFNGFLRNNI